MSDVPTFIAITAVPAFLLLISVVKVALGYLRRKSESETRRLREYDFYGQKFFKAANVFVADESAPKQLIDIVSVLNRLICDPRRAKEFFAIYEGLLNGRIDRTDQDGGDLEIALYIKSRPELSDLVVDVLMGGMLAASFQDNRWGLRARAALADSYVRERRPVTVIKAIRKTAGSDFADHDEAAFAC